MNDLEFYSNVLKALGEPNRLAIALMLKEREMCVCEIVDILPVCFSTISSHLKILLSVNIVDKKREGKWIFYRLSENKFIREILELILKEVKDKSDYKKLVEKTKRIDKNKCSIDFKD